MERTGVTYDQLNNECTDVSLDQLSEYIVKYRKYGTRLGLKETDILEIEHNPKHIYSMKGKSAALFKEWHRKKGSEATYHHLVQVALKLGDGAGAEKICEICAVGELVYSTCNERINSCKQLPSNQS